MFNLPSGIDPSWDSSDVSSLRAFLKTPPGKKLFAVLLHRRPILGGAHQECVALQAKTAEGYELALATLFELAFPSRELPSDEFSAYPDLLDDSKWETPTPQP